MKEKRLYQSPTTRRDVVELEDGFCGSITSDAGQGVEVTSKSQDYVEVEFNDGFSTDTNGENITWE